MKAESISDKAQHLFKNALPVLYGLLIAIVIIGFLSLLFSVIVYFSPLGESCLRPAGIIITVFGLFCGGYIAGRRGGNYGLIRGLILGLLYLFILYLFAAGSGSPLLPLLTKGGYTLLSSIIGGIWGIK